MAIKWDDGQEDFIRTEVLRHHCPCASCQGEVDVMGQLHKGPDRKLTPASLKIDRIGSVGGYALQPYWADGHSSGIFSYDYLKRLAQIQDIE